MKPPARTPARHLSKSRPATAATTGLHPRNRHQGHYEFATLVAQSPALATHLVTTPAGTASVDFSDPLAVRALNRALLRSQYGIVHWDIPPGYLCPPVPGRADYVHGLADLLATDHDGVVPRGAAVRVLDIGVGASCIYPLIGNREYVALGKAHEDSADFAVSFAHYERGNALRRNALPYRADDASARVRRSRELFTHPFLAARAGAGNPAPDPIFIVGLPRSGSTLVEQILSSHSAVEGTMELPEVIALTHDLRQEGTDAGATSYHEVLAGLEHSRLRGLGDRYLDRTRVQRKTPAPFFIDKMPNNFFHVGLIHLMLPNARIIDVRRHPMACCFSGYKQYFARGQNFSYSLDDIGRYYRDYLALMAHFDEVLPGRVHRIVYERLIDDTEGEVRRLLDHCDLPFEAGCLRFFENERPVRTASSEQVRQPIYREGVDHWRHFEPWLAPLQRALGEALDTYPEAPPDLATPRATA
jgi:hypothetical protein